MSSQTSILLNGVTGYIGGAVLAGLLNHPNASTFDITVYIRNADKAKILETKFGVKTIIGDHQEHDKITSAVEAAHITIQTAESDDVPFMQAIVKGLQNRHTKTGDVPILIHTSGTGLLTDNARGEHTTELIYNDLDVEQMKGIPPTAFHRDVDLLVMEADTQGYARTYLILPSTIYGIATHALVEAGIANAHSQQIPSLIKASLARKQAGMVGKGLALWPEVHIDDCADLYIDILTSILKNPDEAGHGWNGFYFVENGEHSWYQISKAIGDTLVKLGISSDPKPTSFAVEELSKYFKEEWLGWYHGTNSRCRAARARALGWKPKYTTEDMLKSIQPETEALIKLQN